MDTRPIIVHSLAHAEAALAVAADIGVAVTLRSAPGAARYLGPQVFRDMIDAARAGRDGARVTAVFDCGDDPGAALGALRHGIAVVRVDAPAETLRRVADIARQSGGRLDDGPSGEAALDLLDVADPEAALRRWLSAADWQED